MRNTAALFACCCLAATLQAAAPPRLSVNAAIKKGIQRIEQGITNYPDHRACFSCHHQAMAVFSLTEARKRGFSVHAKLLDQQVPFSSKTFRNTSRIAKGQGVGGESTSVAYALAMFATAQHPPDDTTAAMVQYLLVRQRKDGAWPAPSFGHRPPTMGSTFTVTALALFALKKYGPAKTTSGAEELQKRIDSAIDKGRAWLLANKPTTTEDKVFHLRGLVDAGVERKKIESARDRLLVEQRPDGSWAQLDKMAGDAYATATVLVALRKAGLNTSHEGYQKGVRSLLANQTGQGAWIVKTRSRPVQRFFDNGDPGGKSQFISFVATNWAVLALLETLPSRASVRK
jgi:hypothetical protein